MVKNVVKNTLPNITKKQKEILFYFYQFRFLTTNHIQLFFNHKSPKRIQQWLKDLKDKGYIQRQYYDVNLDNHARPAIYFLGKLGRQFLKTHKNCTPAALKKIYKENKRTESFISYCLTVADVYMHLLQQKKNKEEIRFFTESQLLTYDYFPNPLPSAYIAVKENDMTKRYFLEVFKGYATSKILRARLKAYMQYVTEGQWNEQTGGQSFPAVLFVCPTEKLKKHISYYAKALFQKEYENKIVLYVTAKTRVLRKENTLVWEKIEH